MLLVIAADTQKELARQIKYLKVDNEILRSRPQGPKGILVPGNRYGSDNSVYAARILWKSPNQSLEKQRVAD